MLVRTIGKPSGLVFMIIGIAMCILIIWSLSYKLNIRFDVINTEQQYVRQILGGSDGSPLSAIGTYSTFQSNRGRGDEMLVRDRIIPYIVTAFEGISARVITESSIRSISTRRKIAPIDTGTLHYAQGSVIALEIPHDSYLNESKGISVIYPDTGEVFYHDIKSKLHEIIISSPALPMTSGILSDALEDHSMRDDHGKCASSSYMANTDFRGFDLPVVPIIVQSADDCCLLCHQTPQCKVWTLAVDNACWLKSIQAAQPQFRIEMIGLTSGINNNNKDASKAASAPKFHIAGRNPMVADTLPCCLNDVNYESSSLPIGSKSVEDNLPRVSGGSPWDLRVVHSASVWTQQWPIGNGKMGALVGGSIDAEVIPLSISGLFVRKNRPDSVDGDLETEVKNDVQAAAGKKGSKHQAFLEARKAMKNGLPGEATKLMKALQHSKLGMFQYVADFNMIFSPKPFVFSKRLPNERKIRKRKGGSTSPFGRQKLTDRLQLEFQGKITVHQNGNSSTSNSLSLHGVPILQSQGVKRDNLPMNKNLQPVTIEEVEFENFGEVALSNGLLDMKRGIARTYIVEKVKIPSNGASTDGGNNSGIGSPINIHSREWFASEIDDVIVGRLACYTADTFTAGQDISGSATNSSGCLNVALEMVRQINEDFGMPYQTIDVSEIHDSSPLYHEREYSAKDLTITPYQLEFELKANENVEVPHVYLCGVALCGTLSSSSLSASFPVGSSPNSVFGTSYSTKGFVCNQGSLLDIFLAIEISDDQEDRNIRSSCFQRVKSAMTKGYTNLRRRHSEFFSQRMNRVQLTLTTSNETQSCPHSSLLSRLKNFGRGCQNTLIAGSPTKISEQLYRDLFEERTMKTVSEKVDASEIMTTETIDIHLVAQVFQFGRYLLFSCGSRSLCNLQGLWADGPTSAWSGDYHLNINVQETYWAANIAGMPETIQPLLQFVRNLSIKGQIVARDLYNCSKGGWVAHGFTDNKLDTGILGDSEWALCVTCGAWLANQAFDYITYSSDPVALIDVIIPALRGVATFFLEYMTHSDSMRSSGPTTSPENSYRLFTLKRKVTKDKNITGVSLPLKLRTPLNSILQQASTTSKYFDVVSESIEHVAMSPAIDMSVLRQAATIFVIAISWASKESSSQSIVYQRSNLDSDRLLADAFSDAVRSMHNSALPHIGYHGRIVEYPLPLASAAVGYDIYDVLNLNSKEERTLFDLSNFAGSQGEFKIVDESLDLGHRHFSSMHWLYPNNFHPGDNAVLDKLIAAGRKTMTSKRANNGGHTSWSSAWEACLWARLYDGDAAIAALSRILREYSASNLLSLHPPLTRSGPPDCPTCFTHPTMQGDSGAFIIPNAARGMTSTDDYKFQIDGNVGFVAAICELLLQTHVPQHILIMPSFPTALADAGEVRGLRGRGDFQADIVWNRGKVSLLVLRFSTEVHPWFTAEIIREQYNSSGFYHVSTSQHNSGSGYYGRSNISSVVYSIKVASPNILRMIDALHTSDAVVDPCFRWSAFNASGSPLKYAHRSHWTKNLSLRRLDILKLPCIVHLCGSHVGEVSCTNLRDQNLQQLP